MEMVAAFESPSTSSWWLGGERASTNVPNALSPRHPLDQRAEERAIPMATLTAYDDLAPGA